MGPRNLDLFDLRCFLAVAERLNFTYAAKDLYISPPALRRRIRDMENAIGARLFSRDTRRVELTPAGTALLPIAQSIIEKVEEIPWALEKSFSLLKKPILYGAPPWLHAKLRKKLLDMEAACCHAFAMSRWPRGSKEVIAGAQSGKLAFGLVRPPFDAIGTAHKTVCVEEAGAVLSKTKFGPVESISLHELTDLTYVTAPRGSDTDYRLQVEKELTAAGILKRSSVEPGDYMGASDAISSGNGFAIVPLSPGSGSHAYNLAKNICLPIRGSGFYLTTCLLWNIDQTKNNPDIRQIVEKAAAIFDPSLQISRE